MSSMKPWARGPFELLKHAEGHLKAGTDFDKRMALISFDNAIEVSIAAYLQLHPTQRGDRAYKRDQVAVWQANYHSKLDFFYDHYLPQEHATIQTTRDLIIWYHNLRNELYHAGNGMVPEESSIAEARNAALWVFSTLYQVDAATMLETETSSPALPGQLAGTAMSPETAFLAEFIRLENALWRAMDRLRDRMSMRPTNRTVRGMWPLFKAEYHVGKLYDAVIVEATPVRNALAHGMPVTASENDLIRLTSQVAEVKDFVHAHTPEGSP